jgi:dipeptidyl aminopeptidase/acylaminoacyl peptidase
MMLAMLLTLALLGSAGYLGAAAMVYDEVSRVPVDCDGNYVGYSPAHWSPPRWATDFDPSPYFTADYQTVRIPSRDAGIELHGWWLPAAEPGTPAIVVIHGRGGCVRHPEVLAPAAMAHRLGYGVLLIDLRDHGASTVEDGRYAGGMEEYRDVMGAVDWLLARDVPPAEVGLLGTSLGAATAIIAAGTDDRVGAVWEDSGYAAMERRVAEELEQKGLPAILAPATTLIARVVSGDDLTSHTVLSETRNLAGRHLFITHGEEDASTYVAHAHDLLAQARASGVLVDEWIVPGAGHVAAMFLHPLEYETRLGAFFEQAFD